MSIELVISSSPADKLTEKKVKSILEIMKSLEVKYPCLNKKAAIDD
tara:strand:- start:1049 stop:1186 length:138 start_codon:yes stop_codon:yes gene_type:complete